MVENKNYFHFDFPVMQFLNNLYYLVDFSVRSVKVKLFAFEACPATLMQNINSAEIIEHFISNLLFNVLTVQMQGK